MIRFDELKDEQAMEFLGRIIAPGAEIFGDPEMRPSLERLMKKDMTVLSDLVSLALQRHGKALMDILATCEGVDRSEYHCDVITVIKSLMELMSDRELMNFFTQLGQIQTASGSASANTKAKRK